MGFFDLLRVPEPEVMDNSGEVEAYSSAAAQAYLDTIDDTLVEHAVQLLKGNVTGILKGGVGGKKGGRGLDIGTGPGQIVIKLARRLPHWKFTGVDRSANMVAQARAQSEATATAAGVEIASRVNFEVADGNRLPFPEGSFDFVMCNSVLHHLADPQNLFSEMARLVSPGGAVLLRDLRRPGRFAYPLHVRWNGRHYSGLMRKLYEDSVRSAYTAQELKRLIDSSPLRDARVFTHRSTHIGFERRPGL